MKRTLLGAALLVVVAASHSAVYAAGNSAPTLGGTGEAVHRVLADAARSEAYAAHFGMSPYALESFFATLTEATLHEAELRMVYRPTSDGTLRGSLHRLPAGTRVLADLLGQPILLANSGYPLTGLKQVMEGANLVASLNRTVTAAESEGVLSEVEEREPLLVEVADESLDLKEVMVQDPAQEEVEVPLSDADDIVGESAAALLGLPILALGGVLASGATGGVTGVPIAAPPIPEPATMIALGLGAGLLAVRRRRKC